MCVDPAVNACDSTQRRLREIAPLLAAQAHAAHAAPATAANGDAAFAPGSSGIAIAAQDRIRELEQALREEQRAFTELEERYRALELQYNQAADSRDA
jgi:hypothetical protein